MTTEDMLSQQFELLGLPPHLPRVTLALPLVAVTNTRPDGRVGKASREEIERTLDFFRQRAFGEDELAVVTTWLDQPPSEDYLVSGIRLLQILCGSRDVPTVQRSEVQLVLSEAQNVLKARDQNGGSSTLEGYDMFARLLSQLQIHRESLLPPNQQAST